MPTFRCKMLVQGGRVIEKSLVADSKVTLKNNLERDGNFVLDVRKANHFFLSPKQSRRFNNIDFFSFNQEFAVLIKSGLSIVASLDAIIEKDDQSELGKILKTIRADISSGESLSGAFEKFIHLFSNLYIVSLQTGEKSGNIPLALSRYIDYMKKIAAARQKVLSASIYPLILTIASAAVLMFLLIYVVPAITGAFFETGISLPRLTQIMITFSQIARANMIHLLSAILVMFVFLYCFYKSEKGILLVDRWKLKLPFLGEMYINYGTSKLVRTLATVLEGGLPLINSIQIASGVLNNKYLVNKLERVGRNLEEGKGFAESLGQTDAFPQLAVRMIAAGESSGQLEHVLNEIAEFYDSRVDTGLGVLTSAIEPALMMMMGLIIGVIVLALYMPIFQLAGTIG